MHWVNSPTAGAMAPQLLIPDVAKPLFDRIIADGDDYTHPAPGYRPFLSLSTHCFFMAGLCRKIVVFHCPFLPCIIYDLSALCSAARLSQQSSYSGVPSLLARQRTLLPGVAVFTMTPHYATNLPVAIWVGTPVALGDWRRVCC